MSDRIRRWLVLGSFMGINLTIQILWISFAPLAGPAAVYFGVGDMEIGALAMVFMVAFVPLAIPVSWALDRFGFRWPVSFGAVLMGACGVVRGIAGSDYGLVLAASIGIAVAQPFLLNAWTKVPAAWFPRNKRAFTVGLITLSNLFGTAIGMVVPPMLLEGGTSIGTMQLWFGAIALVSALVFVVLSRESPLVPVEPGEQKVKVLMVAGLRHALSIKAFWLSLGISFIGLGIFNGLTTWIEAIIRPRGFDPGDAGALGGLMIVGGLAGAVILPALSDREGRRRKYLAISLAGSLPGLAGLAFATNNVLLYLSAFVLGFFLVSALPVTMQYAAEISRPTPEGTSNGLLQLCGQGSVVFVWCMAVLRGSDGSFTPGLIIALALVVVCLAIAFRLPEPDIHKPD